MQSMVLLPLYIFPDIGAWEPLYAALDAYPRLQFTIIINPNSGPGSPPWWPNPDYVRELTRLTQYSNVRLLGYVATGYCKRAISDVLADIDAYAKWKGTIGVCLGGIFFDETPNLWCEEVSQYLLELTQKVKQCDEFVDDVLVIHNPGTSVDPRLAEPGPDITVVVEESYARFRTNEYQEWLATNPYGWEKSCYIVHSVPRGEMEDFIIELKQRAKFVFVAERTSGFYSAFGERWEVFVRAMAEQKESG